MTYMICGGPSVALLRQLRYAALMMEAAYATAGFTERAVCAKMLDEHARTLPNKNGEELIS